MKVLFSARHFAFFRNFESVIAGLAEHGHSVHLAADGDDELGGQRLAEDLARKHPNVTWGWSPSYEGWFPTAQKLRFAIDYLRFLEPRYRPFTKLLQRIDDRVPVGLHTLLRWRPINSTLGRLALSRVLRMIERALPRNPRVDAWLKTEQPDVVLLASITNPRASQLDHQRSAQALRIPTGVCIYSWDHLSSKALIRELPDRVFVWNEMQRREAIEQHRVPDKRIVVTGAQCYDQWFGRAPARTREALCSSIGLSPDKPILLYVCSAMTPDPGEKHFVRAWAEAVRRSPDEVLAGASILVRPHPERREEWEDVSWPELGPLVIGGETPIGDAAKADYHATLCHSAAVVGVLTSAFLEAAIAGRPTLTITPPEFQIHQRGMLHFRYLLEVEGGLLKVAAKLEEHVEQLARFLRHQDPDHLAQQQRFLQAFVRPFGLDEAGTPRFISEVEGLAERPPEPFREPLEWQKALTRKVISSSEEGQLRRFMLVPGEEEVLREREIRKALELHAKGAAKAERLKMKLEALEQYRVQKRKEKEARLGRPS